MRVLDVKQPLLNEFTGALEPVRYANGPNTCGPVQTKA